MAFTPPSPAFTFPSHAPFHHHHGIRHSHPPARTSRRDRRLLNCTAKPARPATSRALIEEFWSLSRTGSFSTTSYLFSPSAVYIDTLYPSPFEGLPTITNHLVDMESAIPNGLVFVLDDLAPAENSVGARWHVETGDGKQIPFSRGASMYKVEAANDERGGMWIAEAWDFVETPLKIAGIVLPVLRAVGFLFKRSRSRPKQSE